MKKKVKFGRDSDECDAEPIFREARMPLNGFTDVDFERQTVGLVEEVMKQHDAEPCAGATNLNFRLKFPKDEVGEVDVEEDDTELPNMSMRATMLANHTREQVLALMDNSEVTCQIKGCTANLSCTSGYFRRNKVCQEHFKAFKVEVGDFEQRYCQQCNRFHMLAEFDEDKRNCRSLVGHNRQEGSHPEATSVLSTGTLVYLPGKVRQVGKNLRPVASSPCEDLERTITNEESTDSENTLKDDASSGLVYNEKSCYNPELTSPVSSQITAHSESMGKTKSEKLFLAPVTKEEALMLEPTSNNCVSAALRVCSSKSIGSKRRSDSQSGHTSVCQVEGCWFDLSNTKDYFKRRKVCERHFKAFKVKVHNVDQRFCQQCSRFHVLTEFDEGRKSCKRMLMGHNMRRRKGHSEAVSRRISKEAKEEDHNSNMKNPQSLTPIGETAAKLGFETHKEKAPALAN